MDYELSDFIQEKLNQKVEETNVFKSPLRRIKYFLNGLETLVESEYNECNGRFNNWKKQIKNLKEKKENEPYVILATLYLEQLKEKAIVLLKRKLCKDYNYDIEAIQKKFDKYYVQLCLGTLQQSIYSQIETLSNEIYTYEFNKEDYKREFLNKLNNFEDSLDIEKLEYVEKIGKITKDKLKLIKKDVFLKRKNNELIGSKELELAKSVKYYFQSLINVITSNTKNSLEKRLIKEVKDEKPELEGFIKSLIKDYKKAAIKIPKHFKQNLEYLDLEELKNKLYKIKYDDNVYL